MTLKVLVGRAGILLSVAGARMVRWAYGGLPPVEEEDVLEDPGTIYPVELSPEARRMREELHNPPPATQTMPSPRGDEDAPKRGSLRERMRAAR